MFNFWFYGKSVASIVILMVLNVTVVIASPFVVSSSGQEVLDSNSGLVWRRCPEGMSWSDGGCNGKYLEYTHEDALKIASKTMVSSGIAWRLPNIKELASIVDRTKYSPAVDRTVFSAKVPSKWFWASTPSVTSSSEAFAINFDDGRIGTDERSLPHPVWLVR